MNRTVLRIMGQLLWMTLITSFAPAQTTVQRTDMSGDWILIEQFKDETRVRRMTLEVAGNKITGRSGPFKVDGELAGSTVTLKRLGQNESEVQATYTGKFENGEFKGDGVWFDMKLQWTARRPPKREGGPRTHTFSPTEFHRVFAWNIPPVLHLFPGDTVQTRSVDAGGTDENSVRRSLGGNPLTGPFFVEGALPGDTLVVRLNRVRTNRDWAGSGQTVVGNALAPGYLMNMKRSENFSSRWKLDKEKGIAYLEKPTDPLKAFTIPLKPMLGCVGVAPPGRDIVATRDSGVFGGNMDYNQIREGTTVYLPVFQVGALLFMGDGHAAQGDGELTGDALETSMDFEFTVDLIPRRAIGMPLAENADYLMAIGIGGSLDQALQRATTEMARWLERDFNLTSTESAMVLGFAMKYDVADLVGTQVSIVAKIPKTVTSQLKRPTPPN